MEVFWVSTCSRNANFALSAEVRRDNAEEMKVVMQEANKEFSLAERLQGQYRRLSARYRARSRVEVRLRQPVISFTFDDFPRSALYTGGAILQKYGASGTYYASLGLMGTVAPTGEIFMQQDLPALLRMGHELGCHTWGHCHPWTTPVEDWEVSIRRNQNSLAKIVPGAKMRSMSYPLSVPTAANKKVCERYFDCSRGRGDFVNAGIADRYLL